MDQGDRSDRPGDSHGPLRRGSLYRNRAILLRPWRPGIGISAFFGIAARLADSPPLACAADHQKRGCILHGQKKWAEALAEFDLAQKLYPDEPDLERLRAVTLLALGRGSDAIAAFNHFLEPQNVDANALCGTRVSSRRYSPTLPAPSPTLAVPSADRASASTFARRGWSFLNQSSMLAKKDFDEALKLEPKNGDLVSGRGFARALLGDTKAAIADAEESLESSESLATSCQAGPALSDNAACIYAQAPPAPPSAPPTDPENRRP